MPLDWDEKLLKMHFPSHSSDIFCSILLQILESVTIMKSAFLLAKNFNTFPRLGLRPILFALKQIFLNLEAELTHLPPTLLAIFYHRYQKVLLYSRYTY